MKRDIQNAIKFSEKISKEALLSKQVSELEKKPTKEALHGVVRLGRMHGFYFSENDWSHVTKSPALKKAA